MGELLSIIMAVFACIAALDKITGNHLKLGTEFDKGIETMGPLSLSMLGMMTISPALADVLLPLIKPVAEFCGFDPSLIAGVIFANDMGGAALADSIALTPLLGAFHGLFVASTMGATVSFTIPVALSSIDKKHHNDVLLGLLCGIITIPVGCLASGIFMGLSFKALILNTVPILLFSAIIAICLLKFPKGCIKVFSVIGKLIVMLVTAGLALGIFQYLTGKVIIKNTAPIMESAVTVVHICLVLAGTFPLISIISRLLKKPLSALGKKTELDETSVLGLISTLANSIATINTVDKMNRKGVILNMAFAVSAAFVFGDHLAFTLSYNPSQILPVIVGKLVAGFSALFVASFVSSKVKN